jgi:sugar transferase (PEP-CTERM/EpsH1 system associated)
MASGPPPLIVHVIHALDVGGLENGVVNLINRTPIDRFRHAIVCMTHSSDFHRRIRWDGVEVISMHRDEAPLWQTYLRLLRLFVRLRPSIVHSRNLSGLDALLPALCAGVTVRVHGEHGRDIRDLDGSNPRYRRLRGLFRPFVSHYTTVSRDLAGYLVERVGVSPDRVSQIYNGVDTELFKPRCGQRELPFHLERSEREPVLIGTVGRLQPVKDQALLLKAFAEAMRCAPDAMRSAYLVIVGDGPMRTVIEEEVRRLNLGNRAFLLGSRDDVASILRSLDLFVLP